MFPTVIRDGVPHCSFDESDVMKEQIRTKFCQKFRSCVAVFGIQSSNDRAEAEWRYFRNAGQYSSSLQDQIPRDFNERLCSGQRTEHFLNRENTCGIRSSKKDGISATKPRERANEINCVPIVACQLRSYKQVGTKENRLTAETSSTTAARRDAAARFVFC